MIMKIILGLAGEIASGKGTAAKYIMKKYGGLSYRLSDILRDILKRVYLPESRSNMQEMSSALRQYFGEDILAKVALSDLKRQKSKLIVLDGIRRYQAVKYLKKENNFKLIYIEADLKKRFARITQRKDNSDDENKTLRSFKRDHIKEAESLIGELRKKADFLIDNNSNLSNLYQSVDEIMAKILKERKTLQNNKNVSN